MTIIPYDKSKKHLLADLMSAYMNELDCGIPEEIIRGKLSDFIDTQFDARIIRIDLGIESERIAGFSVYQIDKPESDWCKRPGWGFIREFYIVPAFRKSGLGRALALHTEETLRTMGAERLYLTSDSAIPFWRSCGWRLSEEICSNDQPILEK